MEASAAAMTPLVSFRYDLVVFSTLDRSGDLMNVGRRISGEFAAAPRILPSCAVPVPRLCGPVALFSPFPAFFHDDRCQRCQ